MLFHLQRKNKIDYVCEGNQGFKLQKEAENKIFQNSCLKSKIYDGCNVQRTVVSLLYNLFSTLLLTYKQVKHSKNDYVENPYVQ